MFKKHMTKYRDENSDLYVTSWVQLNIFNKAFCFLKQTIKL